MNDWRQELGEFFQQQDEKKQVQDDAVKQRRGEVGQFFRSVVDPALQELKAELEKYGRAVKITTLNDYAEIEVMLDGEEEFSYQITSKIGRRSFTVAPIMRFTDANGRRYNSEGDLFGGLQEGEASGVTGETIIRHFLQQYTSRGSYHKPQRLN